MGRLERAAATRGSGRNCNALEIDRDYEILGGDTRETSAGCIGQSWDSEAVDLGINIGGHDLAFKFISERRHTYGSVALQEFDCLCERHRTHHILCSSATPALMPATDNGGSKRHTSANVKSTRSLGRI